MLKLLHRYLSVLDTEERVFLALMFLTGGVIAFITLGLIYQPEKLSDGLPWFFVLLLLFPAAALAVFPWSRTIVVVLAAAVAGVLAVVGLFAIGAGWLFGLAVGAAPPAATWAVLYALRSEQRP